MVAARRAWVDALSHRGTDAMSPPSHAMGRALPPALPARHLAWAMSVLRDVSMYYEPVPEHIDRASLNVLWHHGLVSVLPSIDGLAWHRTPRGKALLGALPGVPRR